MGLPLGHDGPNAALPVGAHATIDTAAVDAERFLTADHQPD